MGAYENPRFIGIQDPTILAKAFSNSFDKSLAIFDKINKERKEREKKLEDQITFTTGHLLGSIKNIHNASEATKDNVRNNVNDFAGFARENKLNPSQLTDAKFSWGNSVGSYNDALSVAYGTNDIPEISKGHPQYQAYTELINALRGDHDFNNPFDNKTRQFTGTLKYTVNGEEKVLAAHEIAGILGSVTGGGEAFTKFNKDYDNGIFKNNSVLRNTINNGVNAIFYDNNQTRAVSDEEIDELYNTAYDGMGFSEGFERDVWYNKMNTKDKTYEDPTTGEKYLLDYNTTDEEYRKIADNNADGVLNTEETVIFNKIKNAHSELVRDYVKNQIVPGVKTKAIKLNDLIKPSEVVARKQEEANKVYNTIHGADNIFPFINNPGEIGVPELSIIDVKKDANLDTKINGYTDYVTNKINRLFSGANKSHIQFYNFEEAKDAFVNSQKIINPDLELDTESKDYQVEQDKIDKKLEAAFYKKYGKKKHTDGKIWYFHADSKANDPTPTAVQFNSEDDLTALVMDLLGNTTPNAVWGMNPYEFRGVGYANQLNLYSGDEGSLN